MSAGLAWITVQRLQTAQTPLVASHACVMLATLEMESVVKVRTCDLNFLPLTATVIVRLSSFYRH